MRLFRPQYTARDGRKLKSSHYHVEFTDHMGLRRRLPAACNKALSRRFGEHVQEIVEYRQFNERLPQRLVQWAHGQQPRIRDRLAEWGLVRARATSTLAVLERYRLYLEAEGNTERHVRDTIMHVRRTLAACEMAVLSDLAAEPVRQYLHSRRQGGMSINTSNHYLQSLRAWGRWLVAEDLIDVSCFERIRPLNASTDRRRVRRPLSEPQFGHLLESTRRARNRGNMPGPLRALLYDLAASSGLRAGELASLRVGHFDWERRQVHVGAAFTKGRRDDVLPLRQGLTESLRRATSGRSLDAMVFAGFKPRRAAAVLRLDLRDAEIPYRDALGRVADFHALRHLFCTRLIRAGILPKQAQALMRHTTIDLTMNTYAHLDAEHLAAAVDALGASRFGTTDQVVHPVFEFMNGDPVADGVSMGPKEGQIWHPSIKTRKPLSQQQQRADALDDLRRAYDLGGIHPD